MSVGARAGRAGQGQTVQRQVPPRYRTTSPPAWPPPDWTPEDIAEYDAERGAIVWEGGGAESYEEAPNPWDEPTHISEIMPEVLARHGLEPAAA